MLVADMTVRAVGVCVCACACVKCKCKDKDKLSRHHVGVCVGIEEHLRYTARCEVQGNRHYLD